MSEKKTGGAEFSDDQVRLKSILGIRPGVYLAFLYGGVLLLVLFFVFLYPGLSNPGGVVVVKTEPEGAAVLLDGVYIEAAPCEVFASKGLHTIELVLPGFRTKQVETEVKGRVIASALFPRKTVLFEKLETDSPAAAFSGYAEEYAAWTFAGEPSAAYQIPLILSEGVYRIGPAIPDQASLQTVEDTIAAASRFAVTRAALRDLVRAKTLLDNNGLSPSPLSLLASAEDIAAFLEANPGTAIWLGAVLNGESQSAVAASSWYAEEAERNPRAKAPLPVFGEDGVQNTRAGGFLRVGALDFVMLPGGLDLLGENFPAGTSAGVNDFYICQTVVNAASWDVFLEARPEWKKENSAALIQKGLAKEGYLEPAPGAPAEGTSGISWHAAKAFCEWLGRSEGIGGRLPPGYEIRLPTEAEWEYAAQAGALDARASGLGLYWEWCEDPFVPLSFISAPATALASPEISVRGGSWINSSGSVNAETRASLQPEFCSPFVSFRPVIAPVNTGAPRSAVKGN